MIVIGLTGGIASGKTQVTNYLAEMGAPVMDADVVAREVLSVGQPAYHEVVTVFGPEVLKDDGQIDRRWLGRCIFHDKDARERLNRITHPRIQCIIQERVEEWRRAGASAVVVSAPLLLESGMRCMVDEVWVVFATPDVQISRLMARDGYSTEEAQARLDAQMALEEKLRHADRVIDNDGSWEETRVQVERMWREVKRGGGRGDKAH